MTDVQTIDYIGMWDVVRANGTKYAGREFRVVPNGRARKLRVRDLANGDELVGNPGAFTLIRRATPEERAAEVAAQQRELSKLYSSEIGQVVTVDGKGIPRWSYDADQRFVIIAVKDTVNVVKLGGDGGRYWRLRPDQLTLVEV